MINSTKAKLYHDISGDIEKCYLVVEAALYKISQDDLDGAKKFLKSFAENKSRSMELLEQLHLEDS